MNAKTYTQDEIDDLTPEERDALLSAQPSSEDTSGTTAEEDAGNVASDETAGTAEPAQETPASDGGTDTTAGNIAGEQPKPDVEIDDDDPSEIARGIRDTKALTEAAESKRKALDELDDKLEEVDQKWASGELSDEERAAQRKSIRDQIRTAREEMTAAERDVIKAEALNQDKADRIATAQNKILASIAKEASELGLDYTKQEIATDFDLMLDRLSKTMQGKTFREIAEAANQRVMALHGIQAKPAAGKEAEKNGEKPSEKPGEKPGGMASAARQVPRTIGDIPVAGSPALENDFMDQFAAVNDPDEAEAMLESMPTAKRHAMFRKTVGR